MTRLSQVGCVLALAATAGAQWEQAAIMVGNEVMDQSHFGLSVSLDGDLALVGAPIDTGDGPLTGAAYLFQEVDSQWQQLAKLFDSDGGFVDYFGLGVALDDGTAVAGSLGDNSTFVFREIEGAWIQIAHLKPDDLGGSDQFGAAVDIDADTIVVGAPSAQASGQAYVFREIGDVWTQIATLAPSAASSNADFGFSVAIDADAIIVGAYSDDALADRSGSAFIFREISDTWQQIAKLTATDGVEDDFFGGHVAISDDTAVIGAVGVDAAGNLSGAAYIFREIDGAWPQLTKLVPDDAGAEDRFGRSVSIEGDQAVIGASRHDVNGVEVGAAYIYRAVDGAWEQIDNVSPKGGAAGDEFGYDVSIDAGRVLVGAYLTDYVDDDSGVAYLFSAACFADINGDGNLNVLDFIAFQGAWLDQEPEADCDGNGIYNALDFICFQSAFVDGCR